jgi:hypothetical protein
MALVSELVQSFLVEDDSSIARIVGQTVSLSLKSRAQLEVLSAVAKFSKTRTASQILAAALEEAMSVLPNQPMIRGDFPLFDKTDTLYTPKDYVRQYLAHAKELDSLLDTGTDTTEVTEAN